MDPTFYSNFMELILLFSSSFLAATLFPAGSEVILTTLHLSQNYNSIILILIATLGNVLGSVLNYLMGIYLIHFENRKWFPFKKESISKSSKLFKKYGKFSLLFAWLPIIGDPITLIAGIARVNFLTFLSLVTIGKALRYIALISLF